MDLNISVDVKRAVASLNSAREQIPFAAAQAATGLARLVKEEEQAALSSVFGHPTAFTRNAFAVRGATKSNPVAEVFAKDRQAAYLEPSEVQGLQVLGAGKRIRTPVDIRTNASGDIPRGAIAKLLPPGKLSTPGPGGYFIGLVRGVLGLWQRGEVPRGTRRGWRTRGFRPVAGSYGTKGQVYKSAGFSTTLKLLVAFTKPVTVKTHLDFQKRAALVVDANFKAIFSAALSKALRTAK